jgi:hypothetical protein
MRIESVRRLNTIFVVGKTRPRYGLHSGGPREPVRKRECVRLRANSIIIAGTNFRRGGKLGSWEEQLVLSLSPKRRLKPDECPLAQEKWLRG